MCIPRKNVRGMPTSAIRINVLLIGVLLTVAVGCCVVEAVGKEAQFDAIPSRKSDLDFRYPRRVSIPNQIPSVVRQPNDDLIPREEREREDWHVYLPPVMYLDAHYQGWQLFLHDFGVKGGDLAKLQWRGPGIQNASPYFPRGLEDGYNACRSKMKSLLSIANERDLRMLAKRVYAPLSMPKPPPTPSGTERLHGDIGPGDDTMYNPIPTPPPLSPPGTPQVKEPKVDARISKENALEFRYPRRLAIPDEIPSVVCNPKDNAVILPRAMYLDGHYQGWQYFLYYFGARGGELTAPWPYNYPLPITLVGQLT
jgi:hypothetical protein